MSDSDVSMICEDDGDSSEVRFICNDNGNVRNDNGDNGDGNYGDSRDKMVDIVGTNEQSAIKINHCNGDEEDTSTMHYCLTEVPNIATSSFKRNRFQGRMYQELPLPLGSSLLDVLAVGEEALRSMPFVRVFNHRCRLSNIAIPEKSGYRIYRLSKARQSSSFRAYYRCASCQVARQNSTDTVALLTMNDGEIIGEQNPIHSAHCRTVLLPELIAQQIDRQARKDVANGILSPRQAWTKGQLRAVEMENKNNINVTASYPPWDSVKSHYFGWRKKGPIPDVIVVQTSQKRSSRLVNVDWSAPQLLEVLQAAAERILTQREACDQLSNILQTTVSKSALANQISKLKKMRKISNDLQQTEFAQRSRRRQMIIESAVGRVCDVLRDVTANQISDVDGVDQIYDLFFDSLPNLYVQKPTQSQALREESGVAQSHQIETSSPATSEEMTQELVNDDRDVIWMEDDDMMVGAYEEETSIVNVVDDPVTLKDNCYEVEQQNIYIDAIGSDELNANLQKSSISNKKLFAAIVSLTKDFSERQTRQFHQGMLKKAMKLAAECMSRSGIEEMKQSQSRTWSFRDNN